MTAPKPRLVFITDNPNSWSIPSTQRLIDELRGEGFSAELAHRAKDAPDADVAIYLSCERIVPKADRDRFKHNVVCHAAALPRGRGWSPLSHQVLAGANRIGITLFEAVDEVDAGPIYFVGELVLEGHELIDEIREKLDRAIHELVLRFARAYPDVTGTPQIGEPTFFGRRTPKDSRLDPDRPLREQFNLLRVVDNDRYPAFFEHAGHIYELRITKRGPVS